jgi:hypothetical protein
MLYLMTRGLSKSAKAQSHDYTSWPKVKWGQASGSSYDWRIVKTVSTATEDTGQLKTLDFDEPDLLANPTVSYYRTYKTWAIGEGDFELNKNDDTKITSIRQDRMRDAKDAVYSKLADIPWNANETGQNGGVTMFSPTNVAASTTYAGIAMDAGAYWKCTGYDYTTSTIASNFPTIVDALGRQLTFSAEAGGGGKRKSPDFGVMDPTAWANVITYLVSKLSWNVNGGTRPANANMLAAGFDNIVFNGVCYFWDEQFGGSTGYIDGAAAEEILMGHSDQMAIVTSNSKSQGFLTSKSDKSDPAVTGELGRYTTGMYAFVYRSPKFFQVAYT